MIVGLKFCAIFCSINTFYIGVCWYIESSFNDIQTFFNEIDSYLMAQSQNHDENEMIESVMAKYAVKRSLVEAIDFHNRILMYYLNVLIIFFQTYFNLIFNLIRLQQNFAHLMDGVIFLTFSIGTVWLSTSMTQYMVIFNNVQDKIHFY